ncbi:MAG TPA: 23S rRNA (uracil(1939)-C(5))-methyltransferase RlmD, partial [Geobacterales bacterium]|nr:23S rRNA (uracil(1939)-C(5))-methyltransferase RlmD [Geobacterales bacterium]
VRITSTTRFGGWGELVRILTPSPDRMQNSPCSQGRCDGCPLVSLAYQAQLTWKRTMIQRELQRHAELRSIEVLPVLPSPRSEGYRTTAKLVISGRADAPRIGIYRRHSHDVVEITDCPLHHPLINRVVAVVKEGIRKGKVPIYHPRTGNGLLRYLVVRVSESSGKAMVIFVTASRSFNEIHHLGRFVEERLPEVTVIAQNVNQKEGNVVLGEQFHFLGTRRTIEERIGKVGFTISPRSFFQVNPGGAQLLYDKVLQMAHLTGRERVVDLYCGVGGISLTLAPQAREMIGMELVEEAVRDASLNARLNRINNCRFEAGDASELLAELVEEGKTIDLLILNPPRKGCDEEVLRSAAKIGAPRLIYVSCSPSSLARDLAILNRLGYATVRVEPVDMFPHTPHVESVALIERQELPRTEKSSGQEKRGARGRTPR